MTDLLITYHWYPAKNLTLTGHFLWLGLFLVVFIALLVVAHRLIPGELALTPQDGPLRLDL